MEMAMWRSEHQHVYALNAWQQADAFATLLHEVCRELALGRDKAWLIYLLEHAGRLMREKVEEGWQREHLAECLFGLSEALTYLALVDYYLVFLRHEGHLTGARADEVEGRLNAVQDELTALAGRLRAALRSDPDAARSASLWHITSPQRNVTLDGDATGGIFLC
jgi:hypothetical protein